jgi:hypothetical protein
MADEVYPNRCCSRPISRMGAEIEADLLKECLYHEVKKKKKLLNYTVVFVSETL